MRDDYYLNLDKFSIEKLKKVLKNDRLVKSHQILKEEVDMRIGCIEKLGIKNISELRGALKNKDKVVEMAKNTGLSVDYLKILRREVNSYKPKPINLDKFPGVNTNALEKLKRVGIKNTIQLFERIVTKKDRLNLSNDLGIDMDDLLDLTKLTDFARLRWVGPAWARYFVDSGFDTVAKLSEVDPAELFKLFNGKLGQEDCKIAPKVAKEVPHVIEY